MHTPAKDEKDYQNWYPFFPLKWTSDQEYLYFDSPFHQERQKVPILAGEVLQLSDGAKSWGEVIFSVVRKYRKPRNEIIENSRPFIDALTENGDLWWRKSPAENLPAPAPTAVLWDITNKCNLRCRHCVVSGGESAEEIDTAAALRLIDEMAEFGVTQIIFSGGEPLQRNDFFKLAQRAAEKKLIIQVATNATLINEAKAQQLAGLNANAQVSLDGATAETHDAFRQAPGSWNKTIKGIERLSQARVPVMIAATVNRLNFNEIPGLYDLARQLGAHTFRILPFVPYGRGQKSLDLEISPKEMEKISEYLFQARQNGGLMVQTMEFECTFSPPPDSPAKEGTRIGCDGAIAYCTINSAGDILPCNFFSSTQTQNIKEQSFQYAWNHSKILNYFRSLTINDIRGSCQSCQWLPVCRTGCIAANYAHGDIFQSNCHCWQH